MIRKLLENLVEGDRIIWGSPFAYTFVSKRAVSARMYDVTLKQGDQFFHRRIRVNTLIQLEIQTEPSRKKGIILKTR